MKFTFEYDIADKTEIVELTVSDTMISTAQDVGYDLVSVATIAKSMIDRFIYRATKTDFWHQTSTK
jgi:hypothetical protein